jgi:hypothetical protein
MATERAVVEVCGVLAAAYPSFSLTRETIAVYQRVLSDLPDELLQTAALDAISKCKWFPTVAELRDAALSIRTNSMAQLSAFEAWDEVCRLIRDQGHVSTPEFSHPWIAAAVRQSGGWVRLCMSENTVADRARFIEGFQDAQRRNLEGERTLPQVKDLALRLSSARRPELPGGKA